MEKGKLYMYTCRTIHVYLSNNCIYVSSINIYLYIWKGNLGEASERAQKVDRAELYMYNNCI